MPMRGFKQQTSCLRFFTEYNIFSGRKTDVSYCLRKICSQERYEIASKSLRNHEAHEEHEEESSQS